MRQIKKPLAVFFDWDGTIVENSDFIARLSEMLFEHFPLRQYKTIAEMEKGVSSAFAGGIPASESIGRLYNETKYSPSEILETISHRRFGFEPKVSLRDGVMEVISTISQKNIPLCIVSNRDSFSLHKETSYLKIDNYFDEIISFEAVPNPKPAPDLLYYGIEKVGKTRSDLTECWMIGDTMPDVICATNAGATPVFVGNETSITPECKSRIAKGEVLRIEQYQDLLGIVKSFD